ncbi:hypothetical protein VP249E411_P0087 [Vibrio phage 249E41-1]|nr:hypothetical protein VP249E411_P0087 [Vibrio phage 249E41-1]
MSVDSKLFVTCGKDKTTEVGQAVKKALDVWVREELDATVKRTGSHNRGYLSLTLLVGYTSLMV